MTRRPLERAVLGRVVRRGPLADAAAHAWLGDRGYVVRGAPVQLNVSSLDLGSVRVERIQSTPMRITRRAAPRDQDPRFVVIIVLDGEIVIDGEFAQVRLTTKTAAVVRNPAGYSLSGAIASTYLELTFHERGFPLVPASGAYALRDSPYLGLVTNVVLSTLGGRTQPGSQGLKDLTAAIEHLVAAWLRDEERDRPSGGSQAERELRDAALDLIAAESSSRELTASALARRLSVSERYLRRAFAAGETSVLREIRRERARRARALLRRSSRVAPAELAVTAQLSGFRTARSMLDAVEEFSRD